MPDDLPVPPADTATIPERPEALAFEVLNEIGIIAQLSRAAFEARLPQGYLLPHFSVLSHLVRVSDGQTPLVLARAFQVPKTSMTHTLAGLERAGLVEMRPNPEDGRSKRVWLTAQGRAFRERAIAALGPDIADILAALPPGDLAQALAPLRRLRMYLDRARDQPRDGSRDGTRAG
jgi:DNA-binding MarR family transcriptional regulator